MAEKSDLKLFGEIEKRVSKLGEHSSDLAAKNLAKLALSSGTSPESIRIIEQIAERYAALTPEGRNYVNKTLGIDAPAE